MYIVQQRKNTNSPCVKYQKMHTAKWLATMLVLNDEHMITTITGSF